MSIKSFIKRNLSTVSRNSRKKEAILRVADSNQDNLGVVNVHRLDPKNAGDYYCAPHHYFKELANTELDIYDFKSSDPEVISNWVEKISQNSLVIGGGGLLNRGSFEMQLQLFESLGSKGKKTVLWGVGHNSKRRADFGSIQAYNVDTKNFGLVGVRDYNMGEEWIPCVSCMHSLFDKVYEETQEIGLIYHKKTVKNKSLLKRLNDYPSTNNTTNLDELIHFIGSSNTVVTDSYHAMYWAMLLNKKVVVIPNSSKFYDFKYPAVTADFDNFESALNKATAYTGILNECRELNKGFAEKVFDYLNL